MNNCVKNGKNFSIEQLKEAADYANSLGKKVYLTLNTVPTNADVKKMPEFIRKVAQTGVHAVIVADLGVLAMVKENAPGMEIHFSTQVGIMNYVTAGYEPKEVLQYFEDLARIPRGSGNCAAVADYVYNWGKNLGLYVWKDEYKAWAHTFLRYIPRPGH